MKVFKIIGVVLGTVLLTAGLTAAKARGRTGGRKPGLSKDALSKAKAVKTLFDEGDKPMEEIAITLGISRATAYRYLDVINGMINKKL